MDRRAFLKLAGATPLALIAPDVFALPRMTLALNGANLPNWDRVLVLVELKGGNDGLNTVVPYRDPVYHAQRPRLALAADKVLPLNDALGLHPSLENLMPIWREGQLGVTLGVGYPNPNRSHFRSIEIWETGSDSNQFLNEGWLARLFEQQRPPAQFAADGVVLGGDDMGPLGGGQARAISMNDPEQFMRQAQNVRAMKASETNSALTHILKVQQNLQHAVGLLRDQMRAAPPLAAAFPASPFGRQMETACKLLTGNVPVAVIKVSLGGFDTHGNQAGTQQRLLKDLADGLTALRRALQEAGRWDRVLVMTYSEFGRRVRENGSLGTDHGTAAPHFILGGRVKGGLYGKQPSLTELDGGDLRFTLDYRDLYATVAEKWWGLSSGSQGSLEHRPLNCIA